MAQTMTAQDKKWRAQSDARTLAEAQEIRSDKSRLAPAKIAAKEIIRNHQKAISTTQKAVGISAPSPKASKTSSKLSSNRRGKRG